MSRLWATTVIRKAVMTSSVLLLEVLAHHFTYLADLGNTLSKGGSESSGVQAS